MYQNRLATLHEFIADANALKYQDKEQYYQNLLVQVFETKNISFINTFFNQSLIKKRIVMLSKSKSKQIHLFKYALLIPMVLGMLVYTSTEALQTTVSGNSINQDISYQELVDKYYKEIEELNKKNDDLDKTVEEFMLNEEFRVKHDNYILSIDELAKTEAFNKYLGDQYIEFKTKNGTITDDDIKMRDNGTINHETYEDYLAYKKTDRAKKSWEGAIKDGVLRLVVNDLENLTIEEKKRYNKKKGFLSKDVFFTALLITDIKEGALKMEIQPNEYASANKRDDSKALLLNEAILDVGYDVIDQVPAFLGCEDLAGSELKKCTTEKITKHIARNFNTEIGVKLGLKGKLRINVIFKIDTLGNIIGVRSRAAHPDLEAEAVRVVNTLPKMIPGKHKGKSVVVPYSLPIIFQVADATEMLDEVDVPFSVVDQVPVFPGCEDLSSSEQKKCISDNIKKHVNKNFNTNLASKLGLKGRQRINVIFKIDALGNITGVRSRAPHPDLEAEAIRVIKTLPKMIPGKHAGKNVSVPYSLPIIFQVADADEMLDEVHVPFNVIEEVPVYPGCEDLASNVEKKDCMSESITNFIIENFDTKIASENGLSGRQRINVIFKIDMEGNITGIRSRAPHPALEAEAIRVISLLPRMKPGVQRGKVVSVPYSLPIIFNAPATNEMLNEVVIVGYADQTTDVPFSVVEEIPVFPGCEASQNRDEQKGCTSKGIKMHVNKNFNTKLAKKLGLVGRQRINVIFKIDTNGNIIDIRSRAPHPALEAEAIRVIKTLPKMIPGKQRGNLVNVPFSLPIIFQVGE